MWSSGKESAWGHCPLPLPRRLQAAVWEGKGQEISLAFSASLGHVKREHGAGTCISAGLGEHDGSSIDRLVESQRVGDSPVGAKVSWDRQLGVGSCSPLVQREVTQC